jgi:hypothetical protein
MRYSGVPSLEAEYQRLLGDVERLDEQIADLRAALVELPNIEARREQAQRAVDGIETALKHMDPAWQAPIQPVFRRLPYWAGLRPGTMSKSALHELRFATKPLSATDLARLVLSKLFPGKPMTGRDVNRAASTIGASLRGNRFVTAIGRDPIRFSLKQ